MTNPDQPIVRHEPDRRRLGGCERVADLFALADLVPFWLISELRKAQTGWRPIRLMIREALRQGDCDTAARLLTRPFTIEGLVEHGDKRGRELGYPTANLSLWRYVRPRFGIYAVRGRLPGGEIRGGAASLGVRPMFDPPKELLEPYFFDYDGDLYGQSIEVELVAFLRDEAKFDSLDALKMQMAADVEQARGLLA